MVTFAKPKGEKLGDMIAKRHAQLEDIRNPAESLMNEALSMTAPGRGLITSGSQVQGQKYGADVYDDIGIESLGIWADGIHSNHASPALNWFLFKFADRKLNKVQRLKIWLESVETEIRSTLNKSNFYVQFNAFLRDGGSSGTASMWLENNERREVTDLIIPHPREIFIARDKYGFNNTVHRKYKMTLAQAREEFGEKNLSDEMKISLQTNPYTEREFILAIYRNDDPMAKLWPPLIRRRPYVTAYIMIDSDKKQMASGSNDDGTLMKSAEDSLNPIIWGPRRNSDEVYYRSPAMDGIVSINRANTFGMLDMEAAQKFVNPSFMAPEGLRGKISLIPYGGTYYRGSIAENQIKELFTPQLWQLSEEQRRVLGQYVKNYFHVDLFQALFAGGIDDKVMTATQYLGRRDARATLMTPILGGINFALSQFFDRFLRIEFDEDRLPPPPQEFWDLADGSFNVEYIGPLAQAQRRLASAMNIENALEKLGLAAQLFGPAITDGVDPYLLADEIMDNSGLPEKIQVPFEKRIQAGQERAALQQAAIEQEQANTENIQVDSLSKVVGMKAAG